MQIFNFALILFFFFASFGCQDNQSKKRIFLHQGWNDYSQEVVKSGISIKSSHKQYEKPIQIVIAGSKPGSTKYSVAGAVCRFININSNGKYQCLVEPNPNVQYALKNSKRYHFIISQTNLDYKNQKRNNLKLTSMFSLYPEVFTLLTSSKSNIKSIEDLRGKLIYAGSEKSASKFAFSKVLKSTGISQGEITEASGFNIGNALCEGKIDAVFNGLHHPDSDIDELIEKCDVNILSLQGAYFKKLIDEHDDYIFAKINGSVYPKYTKDINSFGVMVNLLATQKVDQALAYDIIKLIFDNIKTFKISDQTLLSISANEMVIPKHGLIFPIHPGAKKYYIKNNIPMKKTW